MSVAISVSLGSKSKPVIAPTRRSALLVRDLREELAGDRLGVREPRIIRRPDRLEVGLGRREVALAVVDLAALELRAHVVGLAGDRLAERLDRLVVGVLGVVRHADLEP